MVVIGRNDYSTKFVHFAPLRLLQSRQSIWQLSDTMRPPSRQEEMWSPICNVNGQLPSGERCQAPRHALFILPGWDNPAANT